MSMGYTRASGVNSIPVWQGVDEDIQLAQGGFLMTDPVLPVDTIIPAGNPMVFDETTRIASIMATGVAYALAGAAATAYQVVKGHTFKIGSNFSTGAAGGAAFPITAIDYSNPLFDTITVGTTIGAVAAGALFYGSTAAGAAAGAYPAINCLLYAETPTGAGNDVSIVIRGTAYARRVPYNATIATLLANKITYSQSK
jgi:hypothetical protein